MKLFYSTILIPVLLILTYQQQLFSQETNDVQSLRIVDASYPFDNHTIPKNLHLIMRGDLMTRVRSNSAVNQDLAVTLELLVTRCDVTLIRDTIFVNNLRPLRDTIVEFPIPEPLFLFNMVPPQCESYAFGDFPYGEIKYELTYEVFKIESDQSWKTQEKLTRTFGHFPKTLSKENPRVNENDKWTIPNINSSNYEAYYNTVFKIDSINHNFGNSDDILPGITFYGVEVGLINPSDEVVSNQVLISVYEYLDNGKEFDEEDFTNQFPVNVSYHPMLEPIAFSIYEKTLPPKSSKLMHANYWFDSDHNYVHYFDFDCFLQEGKTFVISVVFINHPTTSKRLKVAYNEGVPTNDKIHYFYHDELNGLHFNHELPYHPVIRLITLLKSGLCMERITNITDNFSESYLNLYPNPAKDLVHIHIGEELHFDGFTVFSVDGKKVMRQDIDQYLPDMSIDVSSLTSGFYIFEFFNSEEVIRKPLIIKPY